MKGEIESELEMIFLQKKFYIIENNNNLKRALEML